VTSSIFTGGPMLH